ncbi:MAG: hypothetical protein DRJ42_02725 [Deltaproteobacteria bacterium]|nr:MAG: hypothetical protein DRJ42_02725 [Deltaproteobacteria bacterium]
MARMTFLVFVAAAALALSGCTSEECVDCGSCEGRELTEDLVDARPGYTVDGEPVVTLRYDLAGSCAGSGARTFAVWRPPSIDVLTTGVEIDPDMAPESEPGSSVYLYRTHMLSIDVRRETGTSVVLAFLDGTGMPPGLRCEPVDGVLRCEEI